MPCLVVPGQMGDRLIIREGFVWKRKVFVQYFQTFDYKGKFITGSSDTFSTFVSVI